MVQGLETALNEIQMVSIAADHLNHSIYAPMDVATKEVNSDMHQSRIHHLHTIIGSEDEEKLEFLLCYTNEIPVTPKGLFSKQLPEAIVKCAHHHSSYDHINQACKLAVQHVPVLSQSANHYQLSFRGHGGCGG